MHGHEDKCDMWLNYYPSDCCDCRIDRRILEWLTAAYDKAMDKHFDAQFDAKMIASAQQENDEREQLARLQAKYGKAE